MSKEKPLLKQMVDFVKFHLADKHCFAPFAGQDYSAWSAFLYALDLFGRGDAHGQEMAIAAMRALIDAAQQKSEVQAVFKKAIPGVLDWGFEHQIWARVSMTWPCDDGERVCPHIHSKPSKKHANYFRCKDCGAEWSLAEPNEQDPMAIEVSAR